VQNVALSLNYICIIPVINCIFVHPKADRVGHFRYMTVSVHTLLERFFSAASFITLNVSIGTCQFRYIFSIGTLDVNFIFGV